MSEKQKEESHRRANEDGGMAPDGREIGEGFQSLSKK